MAILIPSTLRSTKFTRQGDIGHILEPSNLRRNKIRRYKRKQMSLYQYNSLASTVPVISMSCPFVSDGLRLYFRQLGGHVLLSCRPFRELNIKLHRRYTTSATSHCLSVALPIQEPISGQRSLTRPGCVACSSCRVI